MCNHFKQIFACKLVTDISSCQNVLGEVAFGLVQTDELLFDGVLADEVIYGHGAGLADTVGPVGGLLLNGGIPPWVKVEYIVGSSEVQAQSSSLEADEEKRILAALD